MISDLAPWLLKQINLLYTLAPACPHTAVCTQMSTWLGITPLRTAEVMPLEHMGQILLKVWTTCHGIPHLKEPKRGLWEVSKGQSKSGPLIWVKMNWTQNTLRTGIVCLNFHPPLHSSTSFSYLCSASTWSLHEPWLNKLPIMEKKKWKLFIFQSVKNYFEDFKNFLFYNSVKGKVDGFNQGWKTRVGARAKGT